MVETRIRSSASHSIAESHALDQWRGFALLCVLLSHGFYFTNLVHGVGRIGVNLFFFISGILVFRSLSSIPQHAWLFIYKTFFWRRLRRLFPALFVYVILIGFLTCLIGDKKEMPPGSDWGTYLRSAPYALIFATNYFGGPQSLIHLWSISCEMQFYTIAPIFFLIGSCFGKRSLVFYLTVFFFLFFFPALIYVWKNKGPVFDARYHFMHAAWPMMAGFIAESGKAFLPKPIKMARPIYYASLGLGLCSFIFMAWGLGAKVLVILTGCFLIIPCYFSYLNGWMLEGAMGKSLNWLGKRTYSIYLWQEPFTICNFVSPMFHPLGAFISVFIGALFYLLFEKPFLSNSRRVSEH